MQPVLVKILFIGDSGVGKTSLLQRETQDSFTNDHIATIGVDFRIKQYEINNLKVKAQIWDTAGQERFRSIQKPYYRGASAVAVCFSLGGAESFRNVMHWLKDLQNYEFVGPIFLVGCKSDLDCEVPTDEILAFAQTHKIRYMETSAKENVGVGEAFKVLVEGALQNQLYKLAFSNHQPEKKLKENVIPQKKTCC